MTAVFTPAELDELRASWTLDPARVHLNHGSFGALPIVVDQAATEVRARLATNPIQFFGRYAPAAIEAACADVARFLGGDPDALSFIVNATAGASYVMASAGLQAGDEVIVTDHAYGAVRFGVDRYCADVGARVIEVKVPRDTPADEINAMVAAAVTDRTVLAVIDQVTSPTARLFDVAALGTMLRDRGVSLVVDGAHSPGTLDINLRDLTEAGVSVWFGNLHKWVCAPAGTAVLYANDEWRKKLRAPVVSWDEAQGFPGSMRMQGTHDISGWLASPTAIAFHERWGYDRVREYGNSLAVAGADLLSSVIGLPVPPGDPLPLRLAPLPAWVDAKEFGQLATSTLPVEMAVSAFGGSPAIRVAAHLYNRIEDYQVLADGVPGVLEALAAKR